MVQLAAFEDVGEGQLVEGRGAHVGGLLRLDQPVREVRRGDEPAEAQARGQHLARGSRIDHVVPVETLDGADRLAVVAELGVVVVLDDQRAAADGPVDEGGATLGREDGAGRVLVGGGDDDAVDVETVEQVHPHPALVDRHADRVQARSCQRRAVLGVRRVLDGDPARAGGTHRARGQREPLGEPRADHDVGRIRAGATRTVEVCGERDAQLRDAVAVEVGEPLAGGVREHATEAAQPGGPRELGDVRAAGAEVELDGRGLEDRAVDLGDRCVAGDARRAARRAGEVALGGQLRVGLDDDAARHAQLGGERAGRGEGGRGRQAAVADRLAERLLQLVVERVRVVAIQDHEQLEV